MKAHLHTRSVKLDEYPLDKNCRDVVGNLPTASTARTHQSLVVFVTVLTTVV